MSNPSQTPPLFAQSAREIIDRLKDDHGPTPDRIKSEAEDLLKKFMGWIEAPPEPAERLQAINRLFALYREVLDYRLVNK